MGGQYLRRFHEGDPIEGEPANECEPPEPQERELVKDFGEYEVCRAENDNEPRESRALRPNSFRRRPRHLLEV